MAFDSLIFYKRDSLAKREQPRLMLNVIRLCVLPFHELLNVIYYISRMIVYLLQRSYGLNSIRDGSESKAI